jgi:hypothetical protein
MCASCLKHVHEYILKQPESRKNVLKIIPSQIHITHKYVRIVVCKGKGIYIKGWELQDQRIPHDKMLPKMFL